jgi:hypothetical protein
MSVKRSNSLTIEMTNGGGFVGRFELK